MKDAKAVFFLSDSYRKQVIEKYVDKKDRKQILDKSYIIPNGIDIFWHKNIYRNNDLNSKIENIREKKIELIYVGNINKNKNIITTCHAIEKLEKKGWIIDFIVAGKIKDNSVYNKIKSKIKYKGIVNKEQLIELYRHADIFVMPSYNETFGLVYAEAISQGLPVIYTKGQGFDGQFKDGKVGYSVIPNDENTIADAIEKISQKYYSISSNCIKLTRKFDWNIICDEYSSIYKKIIKK